MDYFLVVIISTTIVLSLVALWAICMDEEKDNIPLSSIKYIGGLLMILIVIYALLNNTTIYELF